MKPHPSRSRTPVPARARILTGVVSALLATSGVQAADEAETQAREAIRSLMSALQAELALAMMQWKDIHHMPVIDNDSNLTGLLTWTDVKTYLGHPEKMSETVSAIMRSEVITSTPDMKISKVQQLMETHKINCLPVVKGRKLTGIITTKDF